MIDLPTLKYKVKQKRDELEDDLNYFNFGCESEELTIKSAIQFLDTVLHYLETMKNDLKETREKLDVLKVKLDEIKNEL